MEIEINEYIRTKDGVIAQLEEITTYYKDKVYWFDATLEKDYEGDSINFLRENQFKEYIVKHSFNIIDLIEVGDYINYERILDVTGDYILTTERNCCKARLSTEIKSIVTKEQFESMKYRIGD